MRALTALMFAVCLGSATPALGGEPPAGADAGPSAQDRENARHLMDVGHARFEAKDFRGALEAYRGADALVHVPTTRLALGRALYELGSWVSARDHFIQVVQMPATPAEPPAFQRARETARELADELDRRLPTLQARILRPSVSDVRLRLDGRDVLPALTELPVRVDPGEHRLEAHALGFATFRTQATALEGKALVLPITMVPGASDGEDGASTSEGLLGVSWRTWSYGALAVGAASLLVGGIEGGRAIAKVGDLESACPNKRCSETARPTYDAMTSAATVANVALPIGLAATAAGVVGVVLTSPPTGSASVAVRVGPTSLSVIGAF